MRFSLKNSMGVLVLLSSMLLLSACSGSQSSDTKKAEADTTAKSQSAAPPPVQTPAIEESKKNPVEAPPVLKPRAKAPEKRASSAPAQGQAPKEQVSNAPATPPAVVLPSEPPLPVPAPPAAEPVFIPAPTLRQVTIPSGTIIGIRMIDSVDSSSDHEGQTFAASLDAPVVVDNQVVVPKGAKVYVKLTHVESAGNLKGQSELKLQLDRIFVGDKSYTVESNVHQTLGAAQGAKTAKTVGIGAAIGAAIGAISGGKKGAAIGAGTGAGAGVGIEAVTKGEQVRIDSETRLDFRLERPLELTVQPTPEVNSPPTRNFQSGPARFGSQRDER